MAVDKEAKRKAMEDAAKGAPEASVVDCAPTGALVIPAAAMRLLERVQSIEDEMDDYEQSLFVVFIAAVSTDKAERRRLWKLARTPQKLYDAFVSWQWDTDFNTIKELMERAAPELAEYARNGDILDSEDDDGDGGTEGNVSG